MGGAPGVAFELESADGDQGFPGRLLCRARYEIVGERELALVLEASADRATPVSLTQHGYWQLGGAGAGSALGHVLELAADEYLPVDAEHLPMGPLRDVAGTPFDFRRPRPLDPGRDLAHPELAAFGGYDHSFALARRRRCAPAGGARRPPAERARARARDDGALPAALRRAIPRGGRGEARLAPRAGRGLLPRAAALPDAPNRPELPSAILQPGETHRQETRYRLDAP